ncbi:MAG: hypothetical protein ACJ761_04235, partial [Chloroflexota bacterium]
AVVESGGEARIAYGSVGPRPVLAGAVADGQLDELFAAASPSPTSMRASPDYRLAMLRVLAQRGLEAARRRLDRLESRS